jgi:hypothetical protein
MTEGTLCATVPLWRRHVAWWLIALGAWALAACAGTAGVVPGGAQTAPPASSPPGPAADPDLTPLAPETAAGLHAGLAVCYYPGFDGRHLDQLPAEDSRLARGEAGKPIACLNHRFFGDEPVFDSGRSRLVGLRLRGWMHLAETGQYAFRAHSNDGIRVFVGGRLLVDDPEQHGEQLSPSGSIVTRQPGWYPLRVDYFQRKGSATVILEWRPPGAPEFFPVPAEALAHLP